MSYNKKKPYFFEIITQSVSLLIITLFSNIIILWTKTTDTLYYYNDLRGLLYGHIVVHLWVLS